MMVVGWHLAPWKNKVCRHSRQNECKVTNTTLANLGQIQIDEWDVIPKLCVCVCVYIFSALYFASSFI